MYFDTHNYSPVIITYFNLQTISRTRVKVQRRGATRRFFCCLIRMADLVEFWYNNCIGPLAQLVRADGS